MWYGRNKILTGKRLEAGGGKLLKPVNVLNLIALLLLSEIYHPIETSIFGLPDLLS